LVAKLGMTSSVDFLGFIENPQDMENRVAHASIAIALYNASIDDFSYYADPGKIKHYLGAGVPVILTDVPKVAQDIREAHCGFVIGYSEEDLIRVLGPYLCDISRMKQYRQNALEFAKKYTWDSVFTNAFQRVFHST